MADTAAHLIDRVLPEVPVRQWVLSLPFGLRYRLAYDARLVTEVLGLFVRAVFASLRRRARRMWGVRRGQCGAVTFVRRFGDALNLVLAAYNAGEDAVERFQRRIPPYPETRAYVRRVVDLLRRRSWMVIRHDHLGVDRHGDPIP